MKDHRLFDSGKFNLSAIMAEAWNIYKFYNNISFSKSLSRAWGLAYCHKERYLEEIKEMEGLGKWWNMIHEQNKNKTVTFGSFLRDEFKIKYGCELK